MLEIVESVSELPLKKIPSERTAEQPSSKITSTSPYTQLFTVFCEKILTIIIHRDTMYYVKGGIVWIFS